MNGISRLNTWHHDTTRMHLLHLMALHETPHAKWEDFAPLHQSPLRLKQQVGLARASHSVWRYDDHAKQPAVYSSMNSFFGCQGALFLPYAEEILRYYYLHRTASVEFLDIFYHRFMQLWYAIEQMHKSREIAKRILTCLAPSFLALRHPTLVLLQWSDCRSAYSIKCALRVFFGSDIKNITIDEHQLYRFQTSPQTLGFVRLSHLTLGANAYVAHRRFSVTLYLDHATQWYERLFGDSSVFLKSFEEFFSAYLRGAYHATFYIMWPSQRRIMKGIRLGINASLGAGLLRVAFSKIAFKAGKWQETTTR